MPEKPTVLDQAMNLRQIVRAETHRPAADLYAEARRASGENTPGNVPKPHWLAIVSGKGGVGKSTVALNLAIKLCDFGKKVLLLDADSNLASLDVMLGIAPRFRLGHVLRGERDIEDVLVSPYRGLKFLPGSSGEIDYPIVSPSKQEAFLEALASLEERFDFVLIDTAAGLNHEITAYVRSADETIVVTSHEPTAILDGYAVIKILTANNKSRKVGVLLNAVRSPREADEAAGKLQKAVRHFLNIDVGYLGFIPYDGAVQAAIVEQQPVVLRFPNSGAAHSLGVVARAFILSSTTLPERSGVLR